MTNNENASGALDTFRGRFVALDNLMYIILPTAMLGQ